METNSNYTLHSINWAKHRLPPYLKQLTYLKRKKTNIPQLNGRDNKLNVKIAETKESKYSKEWMNKLLLSSNYYFHPN